MKDKYLFNLLFIPILLCSCEKNLQSNHSAAERKAVPIYDPLACMQDYAENASIAIDLANNKITTKEAEFFIDVKGQRVPFGKVAALGDNDVTVTYLVGGALSGKPHCLDGEFKIKIEDDKIIKASFFPYRRGFTSIAVEIKLIGDP